MNFNFQRIGNVGLRSLTLGTRFLFIFFLAKYLSPSDVGYYGLFTATVGYAMYFVGLDFYAFATREIIKTPKEDRGQLLRGQAALSGLLYLGLLPVALVFLYNTGWPAHLVWWFIPILMLEHFNQEVFRLLVALSEQVIASLILFARQGSWAIGIVILMAVEPASRNLDAVMGFWLLGGAGAAGLGFWKLKKLSMGGWGRAVDWAWVKRGIQVSVWLLIASLALRGIQTVDRYWLEALGGIDQVAAYVLFLGVASTLMVFLDAGVFSFAYPTLIAQYHANEQSAARKTLRAMLVQTVALSAAFAVASLLLLPYLLKWIGKLAYLDAVHLYPWLLLAMVINALGMIPHYALYASRRDNIIIYSHLLAMVAFVAATWALSDAVGAMAVPVGLNIAFFTIFTIKTLGFWWLKNPKQPAPDNITSSLKNG
ncbi:lipopolysaccharide biosynthesis protein [Sulfitobacter sp. 1A13679]|uniref:lipopolysaccharide biosynthesis protein n=1 Tax=Sulfitobacter sp. 1A13679 TaxID=3368597 RepID=UPI00374733E9